MEYKHDKHQKNNEVSQATARDIIFTAMKYAVFFIVCHSDALSLFISKLSRDHLCVNVIEHVNIMY